GVGGVVVAHGPGTVAAELWRVLLRLARKEVAVRGAGGIPPGAHPLPLELGAAFDRPGVLKIGHRVIALERHAARAPVDRLHLLLEKALTVGRAYQTAHGQPRGQHTPTISTHVAHA